MKYIVSYGVTLRFVDGTQFDITKGVHSGEDFPENVKAHWAFPAYAKLIDDSEAQKIEMANADLSERINRLETENASLAAKLAAQEAEMASLRASSGTVSTDASADQQETTHAKKQSSTNK